MTKYISFSSKAAASRLRADAKANACEQQHRDEQAIWGQLITEQLTLDRARAPQAPRAAKRGKTPKPQPGIDDRLHEYARALDQFTLDYCKQLRRRPPRTRLKYYCWLEFIGDTWAGGIPQERITSNKLLKVLIDHVLRGGHRQTPHRVLRSPVNAPVDPAQWV
jgi:hypothetical protein